MHVTKSTFIAIVSLVLFSATIADAQPKDMARLECGVNVNCDDRSSIAKALTYRGYAMDEKGNPFAENCHDSAQEILSWPEMLWQSNEGNHEGMVEAFLASCNAGL